MASFHYTDTKRSADPVGEDFFNTLLDRFLWKGLAQSGRSAVRKHAVQQIAKGRVAGQVLLYALRCGVHRPEHRSVSKAIFLVAECAATSNGEFELPMSESKVKRYWKEFQCVAHLHAAQLLVEAMEEDWLNAEEVNKLYSRFKLLLAIAGRISRAAHDQIPPLGRTSKAAARDGRRLIDRASTIQVIVDDRSIGLHDRIKLSSFLADLTTKEVSKLGEYRR